MSENEEYCADCQVYVQQQQEFHAIETPDELAAEEYAALMEQSKTAHVYEADEVEGD